MDDLHFGSTGQTFLITGATGFIGTQLVKALLQDGQSVRVLSRDPARAERHLGSQVSCVRSMADIPPSEHIDVVVNLAGARILGPRWSSARKCLLRASRVGVTQAVVGWIAQAERKPRLMISASAIGYYGIQPQGSSAALDEHSPPQPIFMSQLCRDWEEAARAAAPQGVQVACTRFGMVLGHGGALPLMLLPVRLGAGGPLGSGRQRLSWIHLEDLLRAMAWLSRLSMDGDVSGAWNFTAPECPTQAEFVQAAAREAHRPSILPTPAFPVRLLLGEQADLLLEGQNVAPVRLLAEGFSFRHPTVQDALHSLM
ncbi:TIGR01777 family oxidoreductase [Massilia endophytica]|uniref:TIGR01777 family oxidoreductase n=1 Tax=Massilia endophytica TaxID=2899220 RepID=UPI001E2B52D6|nr:TIGR01777 family oxidoreductase [Massilia endophytica]UGQ46871.1 TIGR01777 family oxidoreductase [Massilia endophytica]